MSTLSPERRARTQSVVIDEGNNSVVVFTQENSDSDEEFIRRTQRDQHMENQRREEKERLTYGGVASDGAPAQIVSTDAPSPVIKRLFYLSVYMQLINSFDRGIIPGALDKVVADLDMTLAQAGTLNSAFLVGLVVSIPIATILSNARLFRPFALIACGLCLWVACTTLAAMSGTYNHMVVFRSLTGVGDALFQVICVPFIDRNAPPSKRGRWMSLFVAAYPIGIAMGTIVTGILSETVFTWRSSFLLEGMLMIPAVVIGFMSDFRPKDDEDDDGVPEDHKTLLASPKKKSQSIASSRGSRQHRAKTLTRITPVSSEYDSIPDAAVITVHGSPRSSRKSKKARKASRRSKRSASTAAPLKRGDLPDSAGGPVAKKKSESDWNKRVLPVLTNPLCLLGCFGDAGLMAVSSGVGYWTVFYMENTLMVKPSFATTSIGVATVIFSFGGTIAAGRLLDRLGQAYGGKSCAMACALCSVCSFLTIPIGFCLAYVTNAYFFIAYYSLFIFIMLMAAGTFPLAILWTVPREQRVTASAVVSFIVNIFGTVPAPVVVGYLNQGFTSEADKEAGISVMPSTVLYIVICWMVFPTVLGALCGIGAKLRGVGSNVDKHG